MKYYTKSCPHCHYKYQYHDPQKHRNGSPIRLCQKCGGQYIDPDYIELGLLPPSKIKNPKIDVAVVIVGFIFFILSLYCWISYPHLNNPAAIIFLAIAVFSAWCTVEEYRGYEDRTRQLEEELQQSKIRLSNPYYILALEQIDYDVPEAMIYQAKAMIQADVKSKDILG